ncbi:MAG: 16S rRNA (cytidine(1402)-2'-O)-methyltransferase, partial [Dokdonella sp.]|nr:16S rRNA (cytidine(1402)-2'-O)-methyltransferase [Dokdonella sp.]
RALDVLKRAGLVACEDTRVTGKLLAHYGIRARLLRYDDHSGDDARAALLDRVRAGESVALVSDAGTPLVSDPGYRLVRAARAAGCEVSPVPGPCAAIAALSVAGIASDRFVFEGVLPARPAARRERLQVLAGETRTLIVYESSHRIVETLADLRAIFGDEREAALARELTKRFETVIAAPLAQIHARVIADGDQQRGEFVLVVAGAQGGEEAALLAEGRRVFALLREELPPARAARLAAAISGAPRKALYADAV